MEKFEEDFNTYIDGLSGRESGAEPKATEPTEGEPNPSSPAAGAPGSRQITDYAARLGTRLRLLRRQRGLSLQEVETVSDYEFRAAVLGAYERGNRNISVPRLQRLAYIYGVPVDEMLPTDDDASFNPAAGDELAVDPAQVGKSQEHDRGEGPQ